MTHPPTWCTRVSQGFAFAFAFARSGGTRFDRSRSINREAGANIAPSYLPAPRLPAGRLAGHGLEQEIDPLVPGFTLDTSHAYLSARDGNRAIESFIGAMGDKLRHIHLSDASHPDMEGLQLGTGEVDLSFLPRIAHLPVLLEIRGGHQNSGRGFRDAVRRIRSIGPPVD